MQKQDMMGFSGNAVTVTDFYFLIGTWVRKKVDLVDHK
jgi:hypothetical protein